MRDVNRLSLERIILRLCAIIDTDETIDEYDKDHIERAVEMLQQVTGNDPSQDGEDTIEFSD